MSRKKDFLNSKANQIRKSVVDTALRSGAGHIAPSLSCVDILVALYYRVLNYKAGDPFWPKRDRLIFSKAHGGYGLYAVLSDLGLLPESQWENFYTSKSSLRGCVERRPEYGLESGCGSLGHGLPLAVGLAYGAKLSGHSYYTYCLMGDGECQEGTTWEALQFAVKHRLDKLVIIIDANRLQAMDLITNILDHDDGDIVMRFKGFGLSPVICRGHDLSKLADVLKKAKKGNSGIPQVVIAKTIKGYGLKCMEGAPKFHFRLPTPEELGRGRRYE